MFYLKDLGSLLDAIHEIDQDAIPMAMIKFTLPDGSTAKATYVHESMDGDVGSQGTIILDAGDIHTEFDSMQYAIDGIEGLCRSTDTNTAAPNKVDTMSADELAGASADELAGDLVTYLYDKYKGAAYIGEKELNNGAIALRFEWGNDFKDIKQDLSARYGDRITFIQTRSQYAPEQTASGVLVTPPKAAQAVTESIATDKFELVENFPIWAIEPLVNDSWGDYLQYNGEEIAREDFSDIDHFMTTHGYCGIHAPSDELYDQTHSEFTSHPAFGKSTDTCSVYAVKGPWKSLMKEYGLGTEQDAESENYKEMTEDGVQGVLSKLGLTVVNKWYDGNRSRPVFDCKKDNGETICVWTEPPYEAKVWFKDREPGHNRYTEDIITLDSLEHELNALLDEMHEEELNAAAEKISAPDYHAEGAYEDLTDIGGDFEAVEFYKDVKAVCDIAGKPALAEAVIKLHKAYHPVLESDGVAEQIFADYLEKKGITDIDAVSLERILNDMVYEKRISSSDADKLWTTIMNKAQPNMEAVEKAHKVPRDIAVAFNDYVADTLYTRPETHDQLKASEFEFNWDWLDDEAEDVIRVWNATHDPSALYRLLNDADEHSACMHDGI